MDINKFFSALSYFSIFFAPFLLPLILYFVVQDEEVKSDAKGALLSHLLPFITIVGGLLILIFQLGHVIGGLLILAILFIVIDFLVLIWNVVKGIQALL